jgi:peptide/nickel transport system substrate-binding protein
LLTGAAAPRRRRDRGSFRLGGHGPVADERGVDADPHRHSRRLPRQSVPRARRSLQSRGLAQIGNAPRGTFIAYATSPGDIAEDGTGRNGLYTAQLLKAIAAPGLKVEDVFKRVSAAVEEASNGRQIPWTMSSLRSDFYFSLAPPPTEPSRGGASSPLLRAVMHTDLKILDPIWTTAYIVRNHGYMIYDTLFATDETGEVRPQMVETHSVSGDGLIHTLRLRDGLLWHDGAPVTAEDCVASIKRWGAKDAMGQRLMSVVRDFQIVDPKTFRIVLREPTGLVLTALGKPSSNVPFMMPKRVADTDPNTQISDVTGSGPFVFKRDEWRPGDTVVYVRFDRYRPRREAPSGLAGGKVARFDRVEWRAIPDHVTAISALRAGDIDYIEAVPHDLLPNLKSVGGVRLLSASPLGNQFTFRFNVLHKPFDNPKARQAVFHALNQEDFLKAVIGDPQWYRTCASFSPCGSRMSSSRGMEGLLASNFARSQALLKDAGYDGTPIVLMHSTDLAILNALAPTAKRLLEKGGFVVDMQSMDWLSLVSRRAKKDKPTQGGWHAFLTSWVGGDILNPVAQSFMSASCDRAMFGWPCDRELEPLREAFARETDPGRLKALAESAQMRATLYPTHVPLGEWYTATAVRTSLQGIVAAPVPVFWNVEKK